MATFVKSFHPGGWTAELLNECWLVEVADGETTVALVWFAPLINDVIECHAVALPTWKGRWLTRNVIHTIGSQVPEITGARACIAQTPTPEISLLWRRLGFETYDTIAILDLTQENNHG